MPDVREVLFQAAAEPDAGPDVDVILARARTLARRRKALAAAVPVLVLALGLVLAPSLLPRESVVLGPGAQAFPLPAAGEVAPVFLDDGSPVFVVHTEDGRVTVVEAIAQHRAWGMAHLVGWCPSARLFEEPRFGSRFTAEGDWLGGPAPEGLASYAASVEDGEVLVRERHPARPRGPIDEGDPVGPSCEGTDRLVTHRVTTAASPEEAARSARGGWVVVDGSVLHAEGDMPRLCRAPRGDPPRCPEDAPVAHGVEPGPDDLRWWEASGLFLVRFANGDAVDLVAWPDVFVAQGPGLAAERFFAFIHAIEQQPDRVMIVVEPAEWLSGEAADEAARADGMIEPDDTVPNDYYIRRDPDPVQIEVSPDVEVFGDIRLNRRGPGLVQMTLDDLLAADDLETIPFWITIDRDSRTVVRIEEQYVP